MNMRDSDTSASSRASSRCSMDSDMFDRVVGTGTPLRSRSGSLESDVDLECDEVLSISSRRSSRGSVAAAAVSIALAAAAAGGAAFAPAAALSTAAGAVGIELVVDSQGKQNLPEGYRLVSFGLKPAGSVNTVPVPDPQQQANIAAMLQSIGDTVRQWCVDALDAVVGAYIAIERGTRRQGLHLQGVLVIYLPLLGATTIAEYVGTLQKRLEHAKQVARTLLVPAALKVSFCPRATYVKYASHDTLYILGYVQKDWGLNGFGRFLFGLAASLLAAADVYYKANVAGNPFTDKKMQLDVGRAAKRDNITPSNVTLLAHAFLVSSGLRRLVGLATITTAIKWMLQSGYYRLHESFVCAKNGAPLQSRRLAALNLVNNVPAAVRIENVSLALYDDRGAAGAEETALHAAYSLDGLPTADELMHYTFRQAKDRVAAFESVPMQVADARPALPRRDGVMLVVDRLQTPAATAVIDLGMRTGLHVRPLVSTDQLPLACGILAALGAAAVRSYGDDFIDASPELLAQLNSPEQITLAMGDLGTPATAARMLESPDIIRLAAINNPDAPGAAPGWLSVHAMNTFEEHFANSLVGEFGTVHIAVVNDARVNPADNYPAGRHWVLVAWRVLAPA